MKTTKIIMSLFISFSFFMFNCKSDINPECWCGSHKGTLISGFGCSYTSLLILDQNPSETLMVVNSIPEKFYKDTLRVRVKYKDSNPPELMNGLCASYYKAVKIICISKE
jgi:hypothetical protein